MPFRGPRRRGGRGGRPRPEFNVRESTMKSLDMFGLSTSPFLATTGKPPVAKRKGKKKPTGKRKTEEEEAVASSGDEYTRNLLDTYIGQIGACCALGMKAGDVINLQSWNKFSEEERESLRQHLPRNLTEDEKEHTARLLVSGVDLYFGAPRERCFDSVAAGLTHPRVKRWRLRVTLIERRHHIMAMREYQNRSIRRLLARKACLEHSGDAMVGLAAVGGNLTQTGGALQALPNRIQATAEAAARSSIMKEWDATRWHRVLDFRNQETQRYMVPEKAFRYRNPWGYSIVGPLKRGPAIDGGRPREHILLRNERPSHVTILCIVRDAASRLPNNRGTRADICDLLRDSQYVREGATFQQLNTVVSGALDRLHYEENAPVRYDGETKEWCYLHNDMNEEDFERPAWARETSQKQGAAVENAAMAVARNKPRKKKKRKTA
ncbi:Nuclear factor related to kappa-B-binding protein [Gracilaria domingensis]|nr:Nuclear factor related to kappa-B-binding protein [Gracilaria domingensis]